MNRTGQQWHFQQGDAVFGTDGDKIGDVAAVHAAYLVVDSGFLAAARHYIPISAVANYEAGTVYLTVTKDELRDQGWDVEPAGDDETTTGTGYNTTRATETDTLRVPIHEEELSATKTPREIGQVRIDKDVISEEKTIEVPVTEERVRVERHVVDRPVGADDTAFQEGTIEVPVRGEDVQLQKSVRVAEEVEIGKEAVQRTQQVSGTVRREEVRVTDDTDTGRRDALRDMSVEDTEGRDRDDTTRTRGGRRRKQ